MKSFDMQSHMYVDLTKIKRHFVILNVIFSSWLMRYNNPLVYQYIFYQQKKYEEKDLINFFNPKANTCFGSLILYLFLFLFIYLDFLLYINSNISVSFVII